MELANVEIRVRACGFRKAFRDHRPPAALSLGKTNLIAGRLEQLYGSLSDFRIVVIDKRVMEEDDFPGGQLGFRISSLRFAAFREPRLKRVGREERQFPSGIDSHKSIHGAPDN